MVNAGVSPDGGIESLFFVALRCLRLCDLFDFSVSSGPGEKYVGSEGDVGGRNIKGRPGLGVGSGTDSDGTSVFTPEFSKLIFWSFSESSSVFEVSSFSAIWSQDSHTEGKDAFTT